MRGSDHFRGRWLVLLALVCSLGFAACAGGPPGQAGKVTLFVQPTAYHLQNTVMPQDLASLPCPAGERLLGGGYYILAPDGSMDATLDAKVGVEASYPSPLGPNPTTWHVTFVNFTNEMPVVFLDAYCLSSPTPVSTTVMSGSSELLRYDGYSINILTEDCPPGSTLVSGGFQVNDLPQAQAENAGVIASEPDLDASGHAVGWKLKLFTYAQGQSLTATIIALCATNVLLPAPAIHTTRIAFPVATDFLTLGTSACGANQLTAGGGFEFQGGGAFQLGSDPKNVIGSHFATGFSAWQAQAYANVDLDFQVWAACFSV